jgi:hypothetical protein
MLTFKTIQWIIRRFPAILQNRQNVILFHETIHLRLSMISNEANKSKPKLQFSQDT